MRLSRNVFISCAVVVATAPSTLGWSLSWNRYASTVLEDLFYGGGDDVRAMPYLAQLADKALIPIFKEMKGKQMTVLMPSTAVFEEVLQTRGATLMDPRTATTSEMKTFWNEVYPYFFYKGAFNATDYPDGMSVQLDSLKPSPAGDWPLSIIYRRKPGIEEAYLAEANSTWNGTIYSAPYGAGNITVPGFNPVPDVVGVSMSYWPTEPQYLTKTIADLDVANWDAIKRRLSFVADLDNQLNFTLFLPPTSALETALALSDDDLTAFVNAHLVPSRVLLSLNAQEFTTVDDKALSVAAGWVKVGSVNATITARDVLTNGGVIQVLSEALV